MFLYERLYTSLVLKSGITELNTSYVVLRAQTEMPYEQILSRISPEVHNE